MFSRILETLGFGNDANRALPPDPVEASAMRPLENGIASVRVEGLVTVERSEAERIERDAAREREAARDRRRLTLATIALVALIAYAGATWWQAARAQDLLTIARADERSWIFPAGLRSRQTPDGGYTFTVLLNNSGRAPGFSVEVAAAATTDLPNVPVTDVESTAGRTGLVAPNSTFTATTDELSPQVVNGLKTGGLLAIYGTTWYLDASGTHHWTQFCYETRLPFRSTEACVRHNSTDDFHG